MTEQEEPAVKSLSEWRAELKRNGRSHWLRFYVTFMGTPVSNSPRFYRALNLYGDWAMFEGIIASSTATLTGDPLNYVIKVCAAKWKEMQQDADDEADYMAEIERIRTATHKQNEAMAKKLRKIKK